MHCRFAATIAILSYVAQAQAPAGPPAMQPSNGVLELSAAPVLGQDPRPIGKRREEYLPWRGVMKIRIRNVSFGAAVLDETGVSDFDYEVLDAAGQPVERTELGKRLGAVPRTGPVVRISVSRIELPPLKEINSEIDLSNYFKIEPGRAYKVIVRRLQGLPKVDEVGRPVKEVEVSCSFEVPETGLRATTRR
jgi:hypothetical protein